MSETTVDGGKIVCHIDGAMVHSIQVYLEKNHPGWTLERYRETYPDAPILSESAKILVARKRKQREQASASALPKSAYVDHLQPFHEVFGLGAVRAAMNARGQAIMIPILNVPDEEDRIFVPKIDPDYVFNIDLTKTIMMGFMTGMPQYYWGYHGTGKTTMLRQAAARTGRPMIRVQHTLNTEESHIVGQYIVRDGATHFQLGPLAIAMRRGLVYLADEYDNALPSVCSVYQPVLEGEALVIKEAPIEDRVIEPHPNFRFVATGNTNGVGDETGLYTGTQIQNAANYSRFPIVEEVGYMDPKIEAAIISGKIGVDGGTAARIVNFAGEVREAFKSGNIGMTIGPRELLHAAQIGVLRGEDWRAGIRSAFSNRLSRVDRETVEGYAQRVFG